MTISLAVSPQRAADLGQRLARVSARVAAACLAAGRATGSVRLVAVTKTFPAADVAALATLGVTEFGESYDQEATVKAAALTAAGVPVRWHMVGRLQRNKARSVATWADTVHSCDRLALVPALSAAAVRAGRRLDVLVQASLDQGGAAGSGPAGTGPAGTERGGASAPDLGALADAVASADGLRLVGVMAVAPPDDDARAAFDRLAALSAGLRDRHPRAVEVSAGMSSDLEQAVLAGATLVRVGRALLGVRPPLVG